MAGESPAEGNVEVYAGGQWWTICADEWDSVDAQVVCRQLGYGLSVDARRFGKAGGSILFYQVSCSGSETNLYQCSPRVKRSCSNDDYKAGVVCSK